MKLEFEPDPFVNDVPCTIGDHQIPVGRGLSKVPCLCRKMSRAVVIKYSFRGGHQIHVVAVYLCDK